MQWKLSNKCRYVNNLCNTSQLFIYNISNIFFSCFFKKNKKLRGIDGEYDSESHSSNRLAHRRTIHMLEKNRQKKRAIGTLDVAFKKRFFALSGAGQDPAIEGKTPRKFLEILGFTIFF